MQQVLGSMLHFSTVRYEAMAGNSLPQSKIGRTNKGLAHCLLNSSLGPDTRLESILLTLPGDPQRAKGPGYLVDKSHHVEIKGLEESLRKPDRNYTHTKPAHPTSAHH